jgi:glycosyltransferase involved in cell wall biosynthesis
MKPGDTKPRVLMIAYACDPKGSGEHWLGWGWAEQAANNYQVELITTPKARPAVESSAHAIGITPHFVEGPVAVRTITEAAGGGWLLKLAWQKRVWSLAAELHRQKPFDLVHQTTFHSFRMPFLAARLEIPSVWGPIAGGERVPYGFERYLGRAKYSEAGRNLVNRVWLHSPSIRRSFKQSSVIFASNRVTKSFVPLYYQAKCELVPSNALRPEDEEEPEPRNAAARNASTFKLLYVGNCVATRALPLVFEALHQSGLTDYELSIIGEGPAVPFWKRWAANLGLSTKIKFIGKIPRTELAQWYAAANVLVFPALRDSGGSALLEAMARSVPVICLDWAGPGEMVDASSGWKIPVIDPEATVTAFAGALASLQRDPQQGAALAAAARNRAQKLFRWQAKRQLLETTYQRLLSRQ